MNSWHFYIDDHERARRHIEDVVAKTKPGSGFNYCPGLAQSSLPLINSEYGAVSAGGGDRDISWGLRDLTTQLRRHRKIQGFVYTELTDIEWEHNGLVNYDRTPKRLRLRHLAARHAAQRTSGRRLHRLRRAAGDRRQARGDDHGPDLRQPLFRPARARSRCDGGSAATIPAPTSGRWSSRRASRSPGGLTTWSTWSRSRSRCRTIRSSGRCCLTLRDEQNQRFAANFVNLVVKPDRPLPRIERRGPNDVDRPVRAGRFRQPAMVRAGQGARRQGLRSWQGIFRVPDRNSPPRSSRPIPSRFITCSRRAPRPSASGSTGPRVNRQDYPQTDLARTWPSTLALSVNGRPVDRIDLPDDAADARGVLSHLAGVEHGSHGELVDGMMTLTDRDRAGLAAGEPLVFRLAVPDDAPKAGGLASFGATTGEMPLDPTLEFITRDPLPDDLGVDPNAPIAIPAGP